jgi:hypothetical protein
MKSTEEEMRTNQAKVYDNLKEVTARLEAKIDANQTKTDDNKERINVKLMEMREEIKSGQGEIKSTVTANWSELEGVN